MYLSIAMFCVITLSIWRSEGCIGARTPLVHQLPADVTVENRMRVGSLPSLSVKHVTAVESNVAPSVSSPAHTQPKRRRKLGNSDCEDSSRPGEIMMVKCAVDRVAVHR